MTRSDFFVSFPTETEESVQFLLDKAPTSALLTGNWGGKVWNKLKATGEAPSWERLSQSKLWTDTTQFNTLHRQLRGTVDVSRAEKAAALATARGNVKLVNIKLGERRTKVFQWGPSMD